MRVGVDRGPLRGCGASDQGVIPGLVRMRGRCGARSASKANFAPECPREPKGRARVYEARTGHASQKAEAPLLAGARSVAPGTQEGAQPLLKEATT